MKGYDTNEWNFLALMLATGFILLLLLNFSGCATKDRFISVNKAVPKECELALPPQVEIKTNTLQEILETLTAVIVENNATREKLKNIPCINLIR